LLALGEFGPQGVGKIGKLSNANALELAGLQNG
jgi:hypothetical protein